MTPTPPAAAILEWAIISDGGTPGSASLPSSTSTSGSDIIEHYSWADKTLIPFDTTVITGQRIYARLHQYIADPITVLPGDEENNDIFPTMTIQSISFSCENYNNPNPFVTNLGNEYITIDLPHGGSSNWFEVAGITDGTEYDYFRIFDQAFTSYLPFQSDYDAVALENTTIPSTPYDPDNDIYPIDALIALVPDGRSSLTVTYDLNITYTRSDIAGTYSEQIKIDQVVSQPTNNWGSIIRGYQARSSYVAANYRPIKNEVEGKSPWTWFDDPVTVSGS